MRVAPIELFFGSVNGSVGTNDDRSMRLRKNDLGRRRRVVRV